MGLYKGRKKVRFYDFLMLGRDTVLHSEDWKQLSPRAKVLYLHIKAKHTGTNNGNICLHYSELRTEKGFSSDETISGAFKELERKGWITRTSMGGLHRTPTKYGLTGRYDDYITDRSHTVPEKYKESTHSVAQNEPPVGYDSYALKICQPKMPTPVPLRTSESVASDPEKRS
jgi:hypothetical protein